MRRFLVKWKGYSDEEASWVLERDVNAEVLRFVYVAKLGT